MVLVVRANVERNAFVCGEIDEHIRKPGRKRIVVDENRQALRGRLGRCSRKAREVRKRFTLEKPHGIGAHEELFAGSRCSCGGFSSNEHGAKPVFECSDALRERRRRDEEALRGAIETALLYHGDEGFELRMKERHGEILWLASEKDERSERPAVSRRIGVTTPLFPFRPPIVQQQTNRTNRFIISLLEPCDREAGMTYETVPLAEASQCLADIVTTIKRSPENHVVITVADRPAAVLLAADEYRALLKARYREEFRIVFDELDEINKSLANR